MLWDWLYTIVTIVIIVHRRDTATVLDIADSGEQRTLKHSKRFMKFRSPPRPVIEIVETDRLTTWEAELKSKV